MVKKSILVFQGVGRLHTNTSQVIVGVPPLKTDMCFGTMKNNMEAQMGFTASCTLLHSFLCLFFHNNTGVWPAACSCGGITKGCDGIVARSDGQVLVGGEGLAVMGNDQNY